VGKPGGIRNPGNRELPEGARQAKADSELAFEQLTEDLEGNGREIYDCREVK
jgi:hypothetical protein